MQAVHLLGGWGCMLLSFFGTGLPLGTPPEREDPIMAYVAPEECVVYATWTAMASPKLDSPNQTEQLLAEPEVQAFAAALERSIFIAALATTRQAGTPPDRAEQAGKTAALWARTLLTRSGALYLTRLSPQGPAFDAQGAFIVQAGEAAAELDRSLTELLSSQFEAAREVTIGDRKFHRISLGGAAPLEVTWGTASGYLMIGLGSHALEELHTRIRARKEPGWLAQIKANLPVDRRSTVSYVNLKKLTDTFLPLGGPDAQRITAALGLSQVTSFQSVTGLDQTGMISCSLVTLDGQPRGLLSLLDEKGISSGDLKHIPADALVATCFTIDARKVYDAVLAALAEIDPRTAEEMKQEIKKEEATLGISIPDTLGAIGSHWSLHLSTSDGGWLGTAFTADVRDKNRIAAVEQQIFSAVVNPNGEIRNVGRVVRTPFAGQTISHIAPRDPTFSFVLPAWCITDKQIIVGLNPQAVKSVLLRQPTDKSLADIPEVAARLGGGNPPLTLSYYDTPKFFEATYAYAQILLPILTSTAQKSSIPFTFDAAQLPAPRTISKHLRPSVTVTRRTAIGLETETRQTLPGLNVGAAAPVGVALLLPAVQAAREAARRMQSANNMKRQLIALQNHHDIYRTLPAAFSRSKDGQPLLSWRVAILPFMGQKEFYEQFRIDEPWDSEHNKQLIAKMPAAFRSPNSNAEPGKTIYLGVGGPRGVLGAPIGNIRGRGDGLGLATIIDGTSNTIALVEATDSLATIWTKPEEWAPDEKDPTKGLLGLRPNGFLAVFVDGHSQFIPKTIDPEMLRRAFSRDEGKPIEWPAEPRAVPRRLPAKAN